MWFCACLPVWMTEQSAVGLAGEIYRLLLTCNLSPPPNHHPHLPVLRSETKAERLASSWWLHPGPVDSNPPGVFQDVRHEAPQTHLLRPQHLYIPGYLKTWRCRLGAFADGILEERCSLWQANFPENGKEMYGTTTAWPGTVWCNWCLFLFVWLLLIDEL